MTKGSLTGALRTKFLTGIFCLSALGALGQSTPNRPNERLRELKNTEFLILLKSYHTNNEFQFNEFNFPSLIVKQHLTPNVSTIAGGYRNSNYTFSPMAAGMVETNPINLMPNGNMQLRFGLTVGGALYNTEFRRDTVYQSAQYTLAPGDDAPQNKRKRGKSFIYYTEERYDPSCACTRTDVTEITRTVIPRGTGKKAPRFALFPTVTLDVFRGNGLFMIGTYAPGLGQGDTWGGIMATGVRLRPYDWANQPR